MDKKFRIKRDFNQAAYTYDQYAILQRKVADLLFKIAKIKFANNSRILDAGCGTGYFYELVKKYRYNWQIHQLDMALNMCKIAKSYASEDCYTYCGDMENLPLKNNSADGIFSSLAM
jgi:malonyl-CoA O-methyltransferase